MTTAFVLSGGGSLGAVQVGMLQALGERGVTPDLLVGSSAGALNAAFVAGHGTGRAALEELGGLWRSLRRRDVFLMRPVQGVLALAGRRTSLFSSEPLRRLVEANLGYDDLLEARIALNLIGTDLGTGREVLMSRGSAVSAVLASAAIPGVLPPVPYQGRLIVDGCITQHTAIRHAVGLGADVVYLLPTGYACALAAVPRSALGSALQALTLLSQQQLVGEVRRHTGPARLKVLPPLCPLGVSAADFGHADRLITRAHEAAGSWIDAGGPDLPEPEQFLALHDHTIRNTEGTVRTGDDVVSGTCPHPSG